MDEIKPSAIGIRRAAVEDAGRIVGLSEQLGYPLTVEALVVRMGELESEAEHAMFVAELSERGVVGWAHVFVVWPLMEVKQALLWGLVVEENCRGIGVGWELVRTVERWAESRGCAAVVLHSHTGRLGAHAFYRRIGYREVKTQLLFRKDLEPKPTG